MAKRTRSAETAETDEDAQDGVETTTEEPVAGEPAQEAETGAGGPGGAAGDDPGVDPDAEAPPGDTETDEDAPDSEEGPAEGVEAEAAEAAEEQAPAPEPEPMEWPEDVPVPTLGTDDEYTAYLCGYRAGGDDPGYLIMLAEVCRHLGSFFTEEEAEAFARMPGDQWWQRWGLGYIDATQRRMRRPRTDDMWEGEESGS